MRSCLSAKTCPSILRSCSRTLSNLRYLLRKFPFTLNGFSAIYITLACWLSYFLCEISSLFYLFVFVCVCVCVCCKDISSHFSYCVRPSQVPWVIVCCLSHGLVLGKLPADAGRGRWPWWPGSPRTQVEGFVTEAEPSGRFPPVLST